jgi:hypothetical protein
VGYGLTDSPTGQLAWIAEKFGEWTDGGLTAVDRDQMLTNISVYWLTGTAGSSARLYFEAARSRGWGPPVPSAAPTGVAVFPEEIGPAAGRAVQQHRALVGVRPGRALRGDGGTRSADRGRAGVLPAVPVRITARVLNRATLARQLLLERESLSATDAARRVVALQAQQPASPYVALWKALAAEAGALVPFLADREPDARRQASW